VSPPREPAIVVRHCTVEVVRRGGWSWGPAPDRLPRQVLDALAELLTERFATELSGDRDVEITEPVRLEVQVPLATLRGGTVAGRPGAGSATAPGPGPVASRSDGGSVAGAMALDDTGARLPGAPVRDLARLLAEHPDLERLLRLLPEQTRRAYRAVLARLPTTGATGTEPEPDTVDRAVPPGPDRAVAGTTQAAGQPPGVPEAGTGTGAPARLTGTVEVGSVLPFLVAAALSRADLLAGIGPVLDGAGLAPDAPLLATALAYQVLDPPGRGCLRAPATRSDAATFAGLAEPPSEDALVDFARRATPAVPLLAALAGLALCRGHEPTRPLMLAATHPRSLGGGLLLVEPDGLFPIAWADDPAELLSCWEASGRPAILVGGATVGPGAALAPVPLPHLATLATAGVSLVCDAPPTRGERAWRRLPGPSRLWATGDLPAPLAGTDLGMLTVQLDELVGALAARRAVPLAPGTGFLRIIALVAALGLGTLAWLLWRHREPPDPQLALTRLGDLSATVRFDLDEVGVRLPLGRRFEDLRDRGLLGDVRDAVWLDGRILTFTGG
jgi:hypothetical protein